MKKTTHYCDILVAGGGTGGICAAIAAARSGLSVILVSEVQWLGGMLTAAGVSAIDGNHELPSGLWGEFQQALRDFYGGANKLATGWVSHTQYEPQIGALILETMVAAYPNLKVFRLWRLHSVLTEEQTVEGAIFKQADQHMEVHAKVTIDATEEGDLLDLAGCSYDLGRDASKDSGEREAPEKSDPYIQDLTYVAILQDYGPGKNRVIPKPPGYNPDLFTNCCVEAGDGTVPNLVDCQTMLNYGRLPNKRFMLNWPNNGNDYYAELVGKTESERKALLQEAKNHTLSFVYFLQTELGQAHIGLAEGVFPTLDQLAISPYIREGRRLCGMERLTLPDLVDPYASPERPLYRAAIAVGNYPIDHHHRAAPEPIEETFPDIPAFSVPYGCIIPKEVEGVLVAEKCISVSHLVNGCTRLQPVIMGIGQAAGVAAGLAAQLNTQPRRIPIRKLQDTLLRQQCWLLPFTDITPTDEAFKPLQKLGVCGILKGEGQPKDWANLMLMHPDKPLTTDELTAIKEHFGNDISAELTNKISRREAAILIDRKADIFKTVPEPS